MTEGNGEKRYTRDVLAQLIESIDRRLGNIETEMHRKASAADLVALTTKVSLVETDLARLESSGTREVREHVLPRLDRVASTADRNEDRLDRVEAEAQEAKRRARDASLALRWRVTIGLSALFGLGSLVLSALALGGGAS